jgi:aryl-alcohol dehydrogenase-like predicted oxidoreductase
MNNFYHTILGSTRIPVYRLGLSATYLPGRKTIYRAIDEGINYFFYFSIDRQMIRVFKEVLKNRREQFVIATGAYNFIMGYPNLRKTLEKRLRQLHTDYIDIFQFLGVTKESDFPERAREELYRFKDEGKIRAVGISTHDRKFAGKLAAEGKIDVLMIRYNAAHRGAEQDIFPSLKKSNPGVVSFTATRWRSLLRRPSRWPAIVPIPDAGMCYRFVLSNPQVHICMSAPTHIKQLEHNLNALRLGSLSDDEMQFMRRFGDSVHKERNRLSLSSH